MRTPYRFLLAGLLAVPVLLAQNPAPAPTGGGGVAAPAVDPFARQPEGEPEMTPEEIEANRPRQISLCLETFSVDLADAAALQRARMDDPKLYKEFVDRVAKGEAIQEQFMIVRARSGEKALVENISEMIYPTEYMHGHTPKPTQYVVKTAGKEGEAPKITPAANPPLDPTVASNPNGPFAPPLGTSYETRNVGATIEIEPTLGQDNEIIDLRVAPEIVTYAGRTKWSKGTSETEMPNFETQRTTTALTVRNGHPCLLGTPSRPPISEIDPNSAKRVWFSFITPTVVAP